MIRPKLHIHESFRVSVLFKQINAFNLHMKNCSINEQFPKISLPTIFLFPTFIVILILESNNHLLLGCLILSYGRMGGGSLSNTASAHASKANDQTHCCGITLKLDPDSSSKKGLG